jgi:hypothetical protein
VRTTPSEAGEADAGAKGGVEEVVYYAGEASVAVVTGSTGGVAVLAAVQNGVEIHIFDCALLTGLTILAYLAVSSAGLALSLSVNEITGQALSA